jgi:hypothetical protein
MSEYFKIPIGLATDGVTINLNQELADKLNLADSKNVYARLTENGLEIQKMVSVDLEIEDSVFEVLTNMAKEKNVTINDLILETLENAGLNEDTLG